MAKFGEFVVYIGASFGFLLSYIWVIPGNAIAAALVGAAFIVGYSVSRR